MIRCGFCDAIAALILKMHMGFQTKGKVFVQDAWWPVCPSLLCMVCPSACNRTMVKGAIRFSFEAIVVAKNCVLNALDTAKLVWNTEEYLRAKSLNPRQPVTRDQIAQEFTIM